MAQIFHGFSDRRNIKKNQKENKKSKYLYEGREALELGL